MNGPLDYERQGPVRWQRGTPSLWGLAGVLLLVAFVGAFVIDPALRRRRYGPPPTRVVCQRHLMMIGQGILLYANDHGGAMPPDFAALLATGDLEPGVLVCPATSDRPLATTGPAGAMRAALAAGGACSYVLVDQPVASLAALPADAIVAIEASPANHRGMNVLRADGQAEWLDAPAAAAIVAAHAAGVRPLRVPVATTVPATGLSR